jgi:hypothetical protein
MNKQRLDELEKRIERLEWESRHTKPCHCGHSSHAHFGVNLHGGLGISCMACRCDAYSPVIQDGDAA